jgi:hypothetical protein
MERGGTTFLIRIHCSSNEIGKKERERERKSGGLKDYSLYTPGLWPSEKEKNHYERNKIFFPLSRRKEEFRAWTTGPKTHCCHLLLLLLLLLLCVSGL